MPINIAIDGPAGAGKSTVAKRLAGELGCIYVDTGAMYRAMALHFLRRRIEPGNKEALKDACEDVEITLEHKNGAQQIFLNGENVTDLIRAEAVGNMASVTSAYLPVREKLVELQRRLAGKKDVVMDGRDIGTCVLPKADLKIYLTADSRVRAGRRYKELLAKGAACDLDEIERDIIERDERDMGRKHSPLRQAEDAVVVDSSAMTLDEVLLKLLDMAAGIKNMNEI